MNPAAALTTYAETLSALITLGLLSEDATFEEAEAVLENLKEERR